MLCNIYMVSICVIFVQQNWNMNIIISEIGPLILSTELLLALPRKLIKSDAYCKYAQTISKTRQQVLNCPGK